MNLRRENQRRPPRQYLGDGTYNDTPTSPDSPQGSPSSSSPDATGLVPDPPRHPTSVSEPSRSTPKPPAPAPAPPPTDTSVSAATHRLTATKATISRRMPNNKQARQRNAAARAGGEKRGRAPSLRVSFEDANVTNDDEDSIDSNSCPDEDKVTIPAGKPAAFPTLGSGPPPPDQPCNGRHGIRRLMKDRFVQGRKVDDIWSGKRFPATINAAERTWYKNVAAWLGPMGIDRTRIMFHSLYYTISQTIIDEIKGEVEGEYTNNYFPCVSLLNISAGGLQKIIRLNMDPWHETDENPEHLMELKRRNPGVPINPDMPPQTDLVNAIRYLRQEHLPASLLGEWQFPLPDRQAFSNVLEAMAPAASTSGSAGTSSSTLPSSPVSPYDPLGTSPAAMHEIKSEDPIRSSIEEPAPSRNEAHPSFIIKETSKTRIASGGDQSTSRVPQIRETGQEHIQVQKTNLSTEVVSNGRSRNRQVGPRLPIQAAAPTPRKSAPKTSIQPKLVGGQSPTESEISQIRGGYIPGNATSPSQSSPFVFDRVDTPKTDQALESMGLQHEGTSGPIFSHIDYPFMAHPHPHPHPHQNQQQYGTGVYSNLSPPQQRQVSQAHQSLVHTSGVPQVPNPRQQQQTSPSGRSYGRAQFQLQLQLQLQQRQRQRQRGRLLQHTDSRETSTPFQPTPSPAMAQMHNPPQLQPFPQVRLQQHLQRQREQHSEGQRIQGSPQSPSIFSPNNQHQSSRQQMPGQAPTFGHSQHPGNLSFARSQTSSPAHGSPLSQPHSLNGQSQLDEESWTQHQHDMMILGHTHHSTPQHPQMETQLQQAQNGDVASISRSYSHFQIPGETVVNVANVQDANDRSRMGSNNPVSTRSSGYETSHVGGGKGVQRSNAVQYSGPVAKGSPLKRTFVQMQKDEDSV
ncbi:hypothetical protein K504DRAFT_498013 [Pleomassaria siparia CBS 279.74]|uniref:Uncharacterized protein n=1 Tax=Pleomassaria siparia CBS 279.74 TaxID=1314801 RepID=A0A6G1KLF9_9PLEO|nr:hypothetical protein K504DRAFT_498013 [Pleomassaria siparia CBS 279.74]